MIKILVRDANGETVRETDFHKEYGTPDAHALKELWKVFDAPEAGAKVSEDAPTIWYLMSGEESTWRETEGEME